MPCERAHAPDLWRKKISRTMFQKIWEAHLVVTPTPTPPRSCTSTCTSSTRSRHPRRSPARASVLAVRRPERTVATMDHSTPTDAAAGAAACRSLDNAPRCRSRRSRRTARTYGVELFALGDERQGIVHVIGPELGLTQPGMTIVCGDSHTSTHGAFGALAFGIGTSEVAHVLATQCLLQSKPKTLAVTVEGALRGGVGAKDVVLAIIGDSASAAAPATSIEYRGARSARSRWKSA